MANMQDGTISGLLAFWSEYVPSKGLVKTATAQARSSAVSSVLEVLGEDGGTDLKSLDVEGALTRFENLSGNKFTPQTLTAYKSRFRSAVKDYLAFVENPSGWKPGLKSRSSRGKTPESPARNGGVKPPRDAPDTPAATQSAHGSTARLIDHTFPIRRDVFAALKLPMDLTRLEAERLASFIAALVMPEETGD